MEFHWMRSWFFFVFWFHSGNRTLFYGEYKCSGPGANQSMRASYVQKLSDAQALAFLDASYIDGDQWLQPLSQIFSFWIKLLFQIVSNQVPILDIPSYWVYLHKHACISKYMYVCVHMYRLGNCTIYNWCTKHLNFEDEEFIAWDRPVNSQTVWQWISLWGATCYWSHFAR